MTDPANKKGIDERWSQVYALSITETVSWGVLYYSFAVMLAPMQNELGWSRAQLTGAFSLALLVSGIAAYPVGRSIDRHGARWLMTAGSVFASLLVFAWGCVTNLAVFYLIWIGLGVAMGAVLYEPAFAVIATWFERYRNRALTILTLCGGLASVIFVPLAERLVRGFGWRTALIILAAVTAGVTIPLHALVLRRAPRGNNPKPKSETSTGEREKAPLDESGKTDFAVRDAVNSLAFWQLAAAFCLKTIVSSIIVVHLISYLVERDFKPEFAALVIAAIGGSQLPGRIIFAGVYRYVSQRVLITTLFLLQVASLMFLIFAADSYAIWLFAVLFGISNGAATPARASLVAERYGKLNYASIAGIIALVVMVAQAAAPVGASLLYEMSGNYKLVMWALIAVSVISSAAVYLATGPATLINKPLPNVYEPNS